MKGWLCHTVRVRKGVALAVAALLLAGCSSGPAAQTTDPTAMCHDWLKIRSGFANGKIDDDQFRHDMDELLNDAAHGHDSKLDGEVADMSNALLQPGQAKMEAADLKLTRDCESRLSH